MFVCCMKLYLTLSHTFMQDDSDYRGRWKNSRHQHDTYTGTNIPFVDAKVAAALCKGGVVAYLIDEDSGITDQWILDYVVPNMFQTGIHCQVCLVLGHVILWRIFDPS